MLILSLVNLALPNKQFASVKYIVGVLSEQYL